ALDAGRALARPRSPDRPGGVRSAGHDQRAGHHDPARRAERAPGAGSGPPGGHPGGRAGGAPGLAEGPRGARGRPRGVPGAGRRRERLAAGLAALPETEAMVTRPIETRARTFPELFFDQVRQRGDALALRYKAYGIWHRVSWTDYGESVRRVAGG